MAQRRTAPWLIGWGFIALLLLASGIIARPLAFAGFTPTPTPTETPTPTLTPTPTATPVPPPPPPPPETATPTPVSPLLPEVGGETGLPAWPLLALGAVALLAGWLAKRKTQNAKRNT
jgi:hypothetical protein